MAFIDKGDAILGATRREHDLVGYKDIPAEAYYGIQTLRSVENFNITGLHMHPEIINSIAEIKKAAAITNQEAGTLEEKLAIAIITACDEIISGKFHDQFITDPIQGGAGTSFNMNANEVIANRAIELLGGTKGDYSLVNPNNHVNCGQSTNDVVPTSGRLTIIKLLNKAIPELERLCKVLTDKAKEFDHVLKMGRTQLQDAVPIRLGQEFQAFAVAVRRSITRIRQAEKELGVLNLGGTAIGTGLNADPYYLKKVIPNLAKITRMELTQADDLIDATQNLDDFVAISGIIKACAVSLSKMSNDLRLMSSGPRTGLGEINLPPRQNGSSIMPGKVNPVIPEVVNQVAFNIIGNDMTITMAVEAGQLELNAFEPVIFYNLFQSIDTLTCVVRTLIDNCLVGITANLEQCLLMVENSVGTITVLVPHIGYDRASVIAKEALITGIPVRELIVREKLLTEQELEKIMDPFAMTGPDIA